MIGAAFEMALRTHAGQVGRSGEPDIAHVVRVATGVEGPEAVIAALLHDVVEERVGAEARPGVDALSKRPDAGQDAYLARVAPNPLARRATLVDFADNGSEVRMARLDPATRNRLERNYVAAPAAPV